ncbi:MAG: hypothetical protein PHD01_07745, partial [Geobacteraceae bacterium]|nr:hypothetical protein [Geobacteraceae bacterium]
MRFLHAASRLGKNHIAALNFLIFVPLLAAFFAWGDTSCEAAREEENPGIKVALPYHTPLAGEAYATTFLGRTIAIPSRNRENVRSLTLGANFYAPDVGGNSALPIAALYWRHQSEKWWLRSIIGVFVNEVDIARNIGSFQLLGHFENNTIPFADTEIKDGKEVTSSSVTCGTVSGWLGAGIRIPVAPFQSDNDLRLQLYYQGGYFYDKRTSD